MAASCNKLMNMYLVWPAAAQVVKKNDKEENRARSLPFSCA
jgi:hypothetical protein